MLIEIAQYLQQHKDVSQQQLLTQFAVTEAELDNCLMYFIRKGQLEEVLRQDCAGQCNCQPQQKRYYRWQG